MLTSTSYFRYIGSTDRRSESQVELTKILTSERLRTTLSRISSNASTLKARWTSYSKENFSDKGTLPSSDQDFSNTKRPVNRWKVVLKKHSPTRIQKNKVLRCEHRYLARVLLPFTSDPELHSGFNVARNEIVEVSNVEGAWWNVKKDTGETGFIPKDYLSLYDARFSGTPFRDVDDRTRPLMVKAVFPYIANPDVPEEMSFEKDEILEATMRAPGWLHGRKDNGETGIVPWPYFIFAEKARPLSEIQSPAAPPPYQVSDDVTAQANENTEDLREAVIKLPFIAAESSKKDQSRGNSPLPAAISQPPNGFDLLDDPQIAEAFAGMVAEDSQSDKIITVDTERSEQQTTLSVPPREGWGKSHSP